MEAAEAEAECIDGEGEEGTAVVINRPDDEETEADADDADNAEAE